MGSIEIIVSVCTLSNETADESIVRVMFWCCTLIYFFWRRRLVDIGGLLGDIEGILLKNKCDFIEKQSA